MRPGARLAYCIMGLLVELPRRVFWVYILTRHTSAVVHAGSILGMNHLLLSA
jgi:hypothetical protein